MTYTWTGVITIVRKSNSDLWTLSVLSYPTHGPTHPLTLPRPVCPRDGRTSDTKIRNKKRGLRVKNIRRLCKKGDPEGKTKQEGQGKSPHCQDEDLKLDHRARDLGRLPPEVTGNYSCSRWRLWRTTGRDAWGPEKLQQPVGIWKTDDLTRGDGPERLTTRLGRPTSS